MTRARDDLEAAIWQAMAAYRVQGPRQGAFVTRVLEAADKYAERSGRTAATRAFRQEIPVAVHFEVDCAHHKPGQCKAPPVACNTTCWLAAERVTTTDKTKVTCKRCRQKRATGPRATSRDVYQEAS